MCEIKLGVLLTAACISFHATWTALGLWYSALKPILEGYFGSEVYSPQTSSR
jgi:hypothetical protein